MNPMMKRLEALEAAKPKGTVEQRYTLADVLASIDRKGPIRPIAPDNDTAAPGSLAETLRALCKEGV